MTQNVSEHKLEERLRLGVKSLGGKALKLKGPPGFPDRTAILPGGRTIYIEMKRPRGGVVAEHQEIWHADLRAMGHEVEVLWTMTQVDAWLRKIARQLGRS